MFKRIAVIVTAVALATVAVDKYNKKIKAEYLAKTERSRAKEST